MLKLAHRTAALTALGLLGLFFSATIFVESLAGPGQVAWLKQLIVRPGLWLLIPSLAVAGISRNLLARGRSGPAIAAKRRRMALAAGNGLLVLVPCALVLARWATAGSMDGTFYLVQGIELLAGAANLAFLGLNLRDGLRMTRSRVPELAV